MGDTMSFTDAEHALLAWLKGCDQGVASYLLRHYFFMTSHKSEDLLLDEEALLSRFEHVLTLPDFPQRRLARLLCVRTLFCFLLESGNSQAVNQKICSIHCGYQIKARERWRRFSQHHLTDEMLAQWLRQEES